jgi:hypothetical protein
MSASGQKQTFRCARVMSALPPKADIRPRDQDVCFGPQADILPAVLSVELIVQPERTMLSVKWVCVLIAPSLRSSASVEVVIEADPKDEAFELDGSRHSVADQP